MLPLAGAEIKDIVAADLAKADAFVNKVLQDHDAIEINTDLALGQKWFYKDSSGDYLGRPDNAASRTIWKYNQVDSAGGGTIGTWFGYPTRVAKASNFIVAYACRKINATVLSAAMSQLFGTANDSSAAKSWDAGWAVGGGAAYASTVAVMTKDIWDKSDDKNQKLWPNSVAT